jgi:predicted HAD superfamily hydrolase
MTAPTVSYDVFDTVVTRAFAHPRDVFVYLGEQLHEQGICPLDAMAFARARWAAELAARKKSPWTEVLLDDIYRELAGQLGWDAATTGAAQVRELQVEAQHLRGVPLMRSVLQTARAGSGRLLFLSDMYLPAAVLRPWLEREGMVAPGDLLFISGEARGSKSSGELFFTAQRETGGSFAHWQHTGDHSFADVEKPRQLGITARHFSAAHLTAREQDVRHTAGEFAPPWRSLLAGAMRLARLERTAATEREAVLWETGTNVAGPLFYGFVRWTLAEARKRGLRRLYFLARDGQIFFRIAQIMQAAEAEPIECHYLQASRLVFSGPAELATPETLRWLAGPEANFHSLRQTLLQLGLDETWARQELPARFASLPLDTHLPSADREALTEWLLAPPRAALLQAAIARRASRARVYLDSVGLRAGEPVGLVDAGWLGSIQRNIEHIISDTGAPAPLVGFYLGLMPPQPPAAAGELIGYANAFAPLPLLREESHKVLIELMAQSDHGQVIGFEFTGDRCAAVLNDPGPVNLAEIRLFQEAVLCFARRMLETNTAGPAEEFARTVLGLYRNFHDRPAPREALVFGFLPHADQLYEQHYAGLCRRFRLRDLLVALTDYRQRPPHWWIGGQAALGHRTLLRTFRCLKRWRWKLAGRAE